MDLTRGKLPANNFYGLRKQFNQATGENIFHRFWGLRRESFLTARSVNKESHQIKFKHALQKTRGEMTWTTESPDL